MNEFGLEITKFWMILLNRKYGFLVIACSKSFKNEAPGNNDEISTNVQNQANF